MTNNGGTNIQDLERLLRGMSRHELEAILIPAYEDLLKSSIQPFDDIADYLSEENRKNLEDAYKEYEQAIKTLNRSIEEQVQQINDIDDEIASKQQELRSAISRTEKARIQDKIDQLKLDRRSAENNLQMTKDLRDRKHVDVFRDPDKKKAKEAAEKAVELEKEKIERESMRRKMNSAMGGTWIGGRLDNMAARQEKLTQFGNMGNFMQNNAGGLAKMVGGGSKLAGVFKGLGGVVKMVGGAFTKLLGPIGWIIEIVKFAMDTYGDHLKLQAKLTEIETQRRQDYTDYMTGQYTAGTNKALAYMDYTGQVATARRVAGAADLTDANGLLIGRSATAAELGYGLPFNGINETAYQAASAAVKFAADAQKTERAHGVRMRDIERTSAAAKAQYEQTAGMNVFQERENELKLINDMFDRNMDAMRERIDAGASAQGLDYITKNENSGNQIEGLTKDVQEKVYGMSKRGDGGGTWASQLMAGAEAGGGERTSAGAAAVLTAIGMLSDSMRQGTLDVTNADFKKETARLSQELQLEKAIAERNYNLGVKRIQLETQLAQTTDNARKAAADQVTDAAARVVEAQLKLAQNTEKWLDKLDEASNNTARSMGITDPAAMRRYQYMLMQNASDLGKKWGVQPEEVMKMQSGFAENTGRNRTLTKTELDKMLAFGYLTGDNAQAGAIVNGLQIFNKSASDSIDLMEKQMQKINKMGLNARKYTKDFLDNIKLANKYNFKNGVKGLAEMTAWAQKTRFNMSSLSSILDKVQEGGLEGVIKQSAGFQVLGGNAAMYSDPLGMMFDAWNDPDAYAKRMYNMTKGYGSIDRRTGETKFNQNESMFIAEIAKLQGRSPEELRNEIRERNKRDVVTSQLSAEQLSSLNEDQKTLLSNKAVFNEKTGRWEVAMDDGTIRGLNEIGSEDIKHLQPQGHEETIENYMEQILTALKRVTGEEIWEKTESGISAYEEYTANYLQRMATSNDNFLQKREEYDKTIKEGMAAATSNLQTFLDIFQDNNDPLRAEVDKLKESAANMAGSVETLGSILSSANGNLSAGFDELTGELNDAERRIREFFHLDEQLNKDSKGNDPWALFFKDLNAASSARYTIGETYTKLKKLHESGKGKLSDYEDLFTNYFGDDELRNRLIDYGLMKKEDLGELQALKRITGELLKYQATPDGTKWKDLTGYKWTKANDAVIPSNGASTFISGRSGVQRINDGVITNPSDRILAFRPGGSVTNIWNTMAEAMNVMSDYISPMSSSVPYANGGYGQNNSPSEIRVTLDGTLNVSGGGQSVDIINMLRYDPTFAREFGKAMIMAIDNGQNGKTLHPVMNRGYTTIS